MSAGMKLHDGGNPLAPFCVWQAKDGAVHHVRML
jgi:hypothetical protein